jgi:hypothetical protein
LHCEVPPEGLVVNAHPDQLEVSRNCHQEIVEVMRDTPGELAQGFHLLRLTERGFGSLAFRHLSHQPLVRFRQLFGALLHTPFE